MFFYLSAQVKGSKLDFKAKLIDISTGLKAVLLNKNDALNLGVRPHDRIKVKTAKKEITAIVNVTDSYVNQGEIGITPPLRNFLKCSSGETMEITTTSIPSSMEYIHKKIRGESLDYNEILAIIQDIVDGNLSKLEISAFVLSQQFVGMSMDEIEYLSRSMVETGEKIDFDEPAFDKHSVGGVPGNKVSLLIVPIVAAAGLLIPKTSSKAITSPSGTADTMEVLAPVSFRADELQELVKKTRGVLVWGGALNLAPADDLIIQVEHPLRIDPTSQMIASIIAKKYSVGIDNMVLDIPVGEGTKMENMEEGERFANMFVEIAKRLKITAYSGLTYAGQPVGHAVGPALEAKEALAALMGGGPTSLIEKSTALAGFLLELGGVARENKGQDYARDVLRSGKALEKMREIIEAQGGDPNVKPEDIPIGEHVASIEAKADGYVTEVDNKIITRIAQTAGAPRDKGAGVVLKHKIGYKVSRGDKLLSIYAEKESKLREATALATRTLPIIVEGMLLQKLPKFGGKIG
ncbi:MAG: AMP phosphorylase [Candidatus Lokiarchaeia archaeon]